jgi:mono/diheme cytochrome c family protein
VQAALGADFAAFGAADRRVHDAAMRTAGAAANEDSDQVLSALGSLQAGCVACHDAFQDRLRESAGVEDSALREPPGTDRGARVFAAYCAVCHGPAGKGDGPAAAALVPPPSDLTGPRPAHLRGIPRRAIIENGSPKTAMAAWKGVLPAEDLEAVYGFVREMHGHMRPGGGRGRGRRRGSFGDGAFTRPERDAIERAEGAMRALGQTLERRLMATMRGKGPVEAMSLCATQAQDLTMGVALEEGVAVGRSSLRLRNPENVAPDWVGTWLRDQGEGPAAGAVGSSGIATAADGLQVARVLRPLTVGPPCLTCHGATADLAPEITAALLKSYPEDRATGYVVGDLRGAIWAEAKLGADRP